jgi:hypothetical protein
VTHHEIYERKEIFDALGRIITMQQHGVTGGNTVAEKRVDYTYDAVGNYSTITTYADLAATDMVSTAAYTYNEVGRLTDLVYSFPTGSTDVAPAYHYDYDAAGRMTDMYSRRDTYDINNLTSNYTTWAHAAYNYDAVGQLATTTAIPAQRCRAKECHAAVPESCATKPPCAARIRRFEGTTRSRR